MERREEEFHPEEFPDEYVKVMTLSQTGDIRNREAGKGNNPPEWLGMYFEDSSSTWYKAYKNDLVYSSIDLWKGCISVVGEEFDGALVTKEYPIYRMLNDELEPLFLAALLRSRYYQRAFRAITTGHSNRRRTQQEDFESLEVCYPKDKSVQRSLVKEINACKKKQANISKSLTKAVMTFNNIIDGREEYATWTDTDEEDNSEE